MSKKQVDVLRFFRLVKQANVAFNPFDNRIAGFKCVRCWRLCVLTVCLGAG